MDVAGVEVEEVKGGVIAELGLEPEIKKDKRKNQGGVLK